MTAPVYRPPVLRVGDVTVSDPGQLGAILQTLIGGLDREHFIALALNRRQRVVEAAVMSIGSDVAAVADPRVVLRWALTRARPVSALIVAHNHPSGDTRPSVQDDGLTVSMARAGAAVGLPLLDHLVVGEGSAFSYATAYGAALVPSSPFGRVTA